MARKLQICISGAPKELGPKDQIFNNPVKYRRTGMIQRLILTAGAILFIGLSINMAGEISIMMNIKSALLVLGGTMLGGFLAFPVKSYKDLLKTLQELFRHREMDHQGLIKHIARLSRVNRIYGNLTLEKEIRTTKNLFLRKGIELIVDGYDSYEIYKIMEKEYEIYFSRKESMVNIINTLQKLAPIIGFGGTVIGLIDILSHMGAPAEMGRGMAVALLTTLYGLLIANFIFLPLYKKLSEHLKSDAMIFHVVLEGLLDISKDRNSRAVEYRLQSYLDNYNGKSEKSLPPLVHKGLSATLKPPLKMKPRKQNA